MNKILYGGNTYIFIFCCKNWWCCEVCELL